MKETAKIILENQWTLSSEIFSEREKKIISLLGAEKTYPEITKETGLSSSRIREIKNNILHIIKNRDVYSTGFEFLRPLISGAKYDQLRLKFKTLESLCKAITEDPCWYVNIKAFGKTYKGAVEDELRRRKLIA